jgi:hypothetical protein
VTDAPLTEFLEMVRRSFGAAGARVTAPGEKPPPTDDTVLCELPTGHTLVVSFSAPTIDRESIRRRLEMLVHAFGSILENSDEIAPASIQRREQLLYDELASLAKRALALDAIVIDAHSPIVWGAARGDTPRSIGPRESPIPDNVYQLDPSARSRSDRPREPKAPGPPAGEPPPAWEASVNAVETVRSLPEMPMLHKGGQLHRTVNEPGQGYIARSFAAIYVVILVFADRFDELSAKHALLSALPTIETLVLSLPPRGPDPSNAGAKALRVKR